MRIARAVTSANRLRPSGEPCGIVRVGHEPALVEHRGHVGRPQHRQRRRAPRLRMETQGSFAFAQDEVGEPRRTFRGAALRQVDENRVDRIAATRKRHAVDDVGAVLARGKSRGGLARSAFGQRIDAGPGYLVLFASRISVDRQEHVGSDLTSDLGALLEHEKAVVRAGHGHPDAPGAQQFVAQRMG
jgi:hypothetical protein